MVAPVTLVSGIRLLPGASSAHGLLHAQGVEEAMKQGGLVRAELVPSVPGVQDETVAILTFSDREALDRWLGSPERARILRAMDELSVSARNLNVLVGFPGWFGRPGGGAPPRWKQAAIVFVALVPLSLGLTVAREQLLPGADLWATVVTQAGINVAVLTWILVPLLNRLLGRWLYPQNEGPPR